jgi:hypothetical protein
MWDHSTNAIVWPTTHLSAGMRNNRSCGANTCGLLAMYATGSVNELIAEALQPWEQGVELLGRCLLLMYGRAAARCLLNCCKRGAWTPTPLLVRPPGICRDACDVHVSVLHTASMGVFATAAVCGWWSVVAERSSIALTYSRVRGCSCRCCCYCC